MDGPAVKEFADRLVYPRVVGDGFIWAPNGWTVSDPAALVKPGPQAEPLAVYTLSAVRDYITANRDALDLATLIVHVISPQLVGVSGKLQERARARESYVKATAINLTDAFLGKFMAIEEFLIGLQSRFAESPERANVLRLLANIKHETVKQASDDGMTQTVTARAGVALVSEVAVPNPVTLAPFRTFREVTQPQSSFVLRVQGGRGGDLPTVGLFEADGGAWRLVAVDRVRDWLIDAVPPTVAVLA